MLKLLIQEASSLLGEAVDAEEALVMWEDTVGVSIMGSGPFRIFLGVISPGDPGLLLTDMESSITTLSLKLLTGGKLLHGIFLSTESGVTPRSSKWLWFAMSFEKE